MFVVQYVVVIRHITISKNTTYCISYFNFCNEHNDLCPLYTINNVLYKLRQTYTTYWYKVHTINFTTNITTYVHCTNVLCNEHNDLCWLYSTYTTNITTYVCCTVLNCLTIHNIIYEHNVLYKIR